MKTLKKVFLTLLFALAFGGAVCANAAMIQDLEVDQRTTPLGIGNPYPEFRWEMVSDKRGAKQTAYRIEVVQERTGKTVWDSGRVDSDDSNAIRYAGNPLESAARYLWTVTVWNEDGNALPAQSSWFETGLFTKEDWSGADFIAPRNAEVPQNYSIEFDFCIQSTTAGFVFGAVDSAHFLMWQVSSYNYATNVKDWKVTLRPHVWDGYAVCLAEVDISGIIPLEDAYKVHRMKLEIVGTKVYTYIDGVKVDWVYDSPYAAFGKIGFREVGDGYNYVESAYFDNLTVTDDDTGRILYQNDFSENSAPFTVGTLADGVFRQEWNSVAELCGVMPETGTSAPMFRKEFVLSKEVASARLYATALGVYEAYINGKKVGSDKMAPGWTDYMEELQYQVYDVTDMLASGSNTFGAIVGNGWYSGHVSTGGLVNRYGEDEAFLGKLSVTYTDGTQEIFITDTSWKAALNGPYLETCNQNGERYDARKEFPGWNCSAFDDSAWLGTKIATNSSIRTLVDPQSIRLIAEVQDPVQVTGELPVSFLAETSPGVYVYDVGQNIAGVIRIRVKGEAGTTLRIRHGEMVYKDSNKLYTENLREAKATDCYTLRGDENGEVYEPVFTFHGFRYVEISGLGYQPEAEDITALVIHSKLDRTGWIKTGHDKINRLFNNVIWSQRGNYLSIPTDCPQRDERLGWTGDAQVFSRTGAMNFDTDAFMTKFIRDVDTARNKETGAIYDIAPKQGHAVGEGNSGWSDFAVIVPWNLYLTYGDRTVLEDSWTMMTELIRYYTDKAGADRLLPADAYGDWLAVETTPGEVTATSFYAYSTSLMERIADVLGETEQAEEYRKLFEEIRAAYNTAFVNPDTGVIKGDTQTVYILALRFDLLPTEELRRKAGENLVKRIEAQGMHLSTGTMGCGHLLPALSDAGYDELAYQLLLTESYPSWLYSVVNGATTIWERWNSYIAETGTFGNTGMNSFNHYAYGAVAEWLYTHAAGIRCDESAPGYKHIVICPAPNARIGWLEASYESVYGRIGSSWRCDGSDLTLRVTIPANTTATVYVPSAVGTAVTVDGSTDFEALPTVFYLGREKDRAIFELQSGSYEFRSSMKETVSVFVGADNSIKGHTFAELYINGVKTSAVTVEKGSTVKVEARALNGDYVLDSWTYGEEKSSENPLTFTPEADVSLSASFRYNGRNNMALGKTVTALTNDGTPPYWQLSNLTDGLYIATDERYGYASAGSGSPDAHQWIVLDLGHEAVFDEVKLFPRTEAYAEGGLTPAFPVDFTIQVSADGVTYTTVAQKTGYEAPYRVPASFRFDPQTARYIKIDATKLGKISTNDSCYRLQFAEIGVYSSVNALWLSYDGETERILLEGETYTFPAVYRGDAVSAWRCDGDSYRPGETVDVKAVEGRTFIPLAVKTYAPKPNRFDRELGQLIYFNNFNGECDNLADLAVLDAEGSYLIAGKYAVKGGNFNTVYDDPGTMVHGIELISGKGRGNRFTYTDAASTPIRGKLTLVYEAYTSDGKNLTMFNVADAPVFGGDEWIGYRLDWSGGGLTPQTWTSWRTKSVAASDALTRIGTRAGELGRNVYFHSVAVYLTEPENALWLTDEQGENREFIVVPGDSFTFPEICFDRLAVSWTDGKDTYFSGESVLLSAVAGKTFYPTQIFERPKLLGVMSIVERQSKGIRYACFVSDTVRESDLIEEYGVIVASEERLQGMDSEGTEAFDLLVFDTDGKKAGVLADGVTPYRAGIAFSKDGKDRSVKLTPEEASGFFREDLLDEIISDGYYFTVILDSISAENDQKALVVKPYVKIGGRYYYGKAVSGSLAEAEAALRQYYETSGAKDTENESIPAAISVT